MGAATQLREREHDDMSPGRALADWLLYAWCPFKRDAKLFGKLERAQIRVIAEAKDTTG